MADWTPRKERSHRRILELAARLLRERGVQGTGVEEVMNAAGLTRGGFYAHFADKEALVAEALGAAFDEARRNLFETREPLTEGPWRDRTTHVYLHRRHVEAPGAGCAIPSLGGEIARQGPAVRAAFTRGLEDILTLIDSRLSASGRRSKRPSSDAVALMALWIGGVTMARAVDDPELADAILKACRAAAPSTATRSKSAAPRRGKTSGDARDAGRSQARAARRPPKKG